MTETPALSNSDKLDLIAWGVLELLRKVDIVSQEQQDVDAATAQDTAAVADLGTQDAAIEAAQAELLAQIQSLQGQGVNTASLAAASASLATALGANDSTVAALTAAAQPPATGSTPGSSPATPFS